MVADTPPAALDPQLRFVQLLTSHLTFTRKPKHTHSSLAWVVLFVWLLTRGGTGTGRHTA